MYMYVYGLDLTLECVVVSFIQKRDKKYHIAIATFFQELMWKDAKFHHVLIKVQFLDDVKLGHVLITNTNTNLIIFFSRSFYCISLPVSLLLFKAN